MLRTRKIYCEYNQPPISYTILYQTLSKRFRKLKQIIHPTVGRCLLQCFEGCRCNTDLILLACSVLLIRQFLSMRPLNWFNSQACSASGFKLAQVLFPSVSDICLTNDQADFGFDSVEVCLLIVLQFSSGI